MKLLKFIKIRTLIILIIIAILAMMVVILWPSETENAPMNKCTITEARVKQIKDLVQLQTLEIYEETSIKDTINGKGVFAMVRLEGSISYDLEQLKIDSIGKDSIRVTLPPEKVELLESTLPNSYRIIDVWNVKYPLLPANLTAEEENKLKQQFVKNKQQLAYNNGYVKQANQSARETLTKLFSLIPSIYVEIAN